MSEYRGNICTKKSVWVFFALQTSSVEALPGAAQGANPVVVRLDEEHHPQPVEAGAAAHKGKAQRLPRLPQHQAALATLRRELCLLAFGFFFPLSTEAARAGWASGAAEGPPSLGAEGAEGPAGAAAARLGEDAQQQPGLSHVVGEVRLWQRWVVLTRDVTVWKFHITVIATKIIMTIVIIMVCWNVLKMYTHWNHLTGFYFENTNKKTGTILKQRCNS